MNSSTTPTESGKFLPLDIDIKQWRREIETFVQSISNDLNSINDELAGSIHDKPRTVCSEPQSKQAGNDQTINQPEASLTIRHNDNSRLTSLKEKLARQVARTNA